MIALETLKRRASNSGYFSQFDKRCAPDGRTEHNFEVFWEKYLEEAYICSSICLSDSFSKSYRIPPKFTGSIADDPQNSTATQLDVNVLSGDDRFGVSPYTKSSDCVRLKMKFGGSSAIMPVNFGGTTRSVEFQATSPAIPPLLERNLRSQILPLYKKQRVWRKIKDFPPC